MRYFFVMNPGSRGGKSGKRLNQIIEILNQSKITFDYKMTTSLNDAYTYSVKANKEGYDVVVAVGGDGTINRCLNGFYDSVGKRISKAGFAVIYTGTSPDFCKSYKIPLDPNEAVKLILNGKSKKVSVGKIKHLNLFDESLNGKYISHAEGKHTTSYFACCANIGLGPAIARNANSGIRSTMGDFLGTFISMLRAIKRYKPCSLEIVNDNDLADINDVYNISIGITPYIASGIKVKNSLSVGDDRMYTLVAKNIHLSNLCEIFLKLYAGKNFDNNGRLALSYSRTIEIAGNSQNPEIEFDGDPRGFLPCSIQIASESLDLICGV